MTGCKDALAAAAVEVLGPYRKLDCDAQQALGNGKDLWTVVTEVRGTPADVAIHEPYRLMSPTPSGQRSSPCSVAGLVVPGRRWTAGPC